jgi:hypothetical protein
MFCRSRFFSISLTGLPMPTYTLFFLDQEDKTAAVSEVECPDDHSALTTAATLKGGHYDVEVMCGRRTVGRPTLENMDRGGSTGLAAVGRKDG